MPQAYESGQGTIIPTLFVGLGGVGSRIVDRIAGRAERLPNWSTQLEGLNTFLSIDTNELDQHKLKYIRPGNRINIAAFDKAKVVQYLRKSQDVQTRDWLDAAYQPRPGFKPGAGQIRLESRLGFFYHSPEIRRRIDELVADLLRPNNTWRQPRPPKIHVYLFCSLAGGTGSGSFLSAGYLIDEIIRERQWQPRLIANLLLSTLLTDKVGPELHSDIHANTYAALKELEHLTKLDYDQVKQTGRTSDSFAYVRDENSDEVPRVTQRPFFMTFVVDRPPHLGLRNAEAVIADSAFLQVFTPIIDNLAGELDNYEKKLEGLTKYPGDLADVGEGYTKNFGAYGAAAMVLPGDDLLDYCALRFAAQGIRSQITFGVDRSAPGDDRVRALAKLAVDYGDPRFQKMSEQGRGQAINDSFVRSVRELRRQDAAEDLQDGYWFRLVESVDEGAVTGTDDKGEEQRGITLMDRVEQKLAEQRERLITRISIKDRSMFFPKESVNIYIDSIAKLEEEIRLGNQLVTTQSPELVSAAEEGDAINDLGLDPIAERYLVIRLLEHCTGVWLPQAEDQFAKAEKADLLANPGVRRRLREEIYESLQRAATGPGGIKGIVRNRDRDFEQVRQEAQNEYSRVRGAAIKLLDAKVRLAQFRALHEYLKRRSRQFVRLATRMDTLVRELEAEAERLRSGEHSRVAPLALRVEILQTLTEPRERIWDRVYDELFVAGGRFLATFDRQVLARTITNELKPTVDESGRVEEKTLERTVADLKRALVDLGNKHLAPRIKGEEGLDLVRGLDLEARLMLTDRAGAEGPGADAIAEYKTMKLRALAQIAGVLARVSTTETKALADGVVVNRTRQLILGIDTETAGHGGEAFQHQLQDILSESGRQVKVDRWHDPRLIIVHDVEQPIPLYYFPAITDEIEEAYLRVAADEQRGYHLHTDFRWERSLPNLNPRGSELGVSWALEILESGLVTGVIRPVRGTWAWVDSDGKPELVLHSLLSGTLYKLGEIHGRDKLREALESQIESAAEAFGTEVVTKKRTKLDQWLDTRLQETEKKELSASASKDDFLDRPVIRALQRLLRGRGELPAGDHAAPIGYQPLDLDVD
ncbi:MAG: hypothetical protein LGR52_07545 [Candidatus Thiosymbion ectosymbiont of Robbea hypermnestra]|nr:hypothetical protein [Candidatus Thiosymbion ectosymbiont of Robbea hypermnestra]